MHPDLKDAELVVVSDIHIRGAEDEKSQALLRLIGQIREAKPKYFVLLGDIFDFYFGASKYFHKKFAKLGSALSDLSNSGVQVVFFEGNHEFDMHKAPWTGVQFVGEGDRILPLGADRAVKMAHGDLVYASPGYLRFRNFVKSKSVRTIARLMPSLFLDSYALWHASHSRQQERPLNQKSLEERAFSWLDEGPVKAKVGVIGHFHLPIAAQSPDKNKHIFCMHSWDQPSFLLWKKNETLPIRVFLNSET